jgi:hypothetical protein
MRKWTSQWNWSVIYMTVTERRKIEVDRQKRRNKKDLLRVAGYIIGLIMWSICLLGISDFIAGGW